MVAYEKAPGEALYPPRVRILMEGAKLTSGDRDKAYGPPILNLTLAGELKAKLRERATRALSPGELEALDMVCTKLSRIVTGTFKPDNYVDMATYAAIAGEVAEYYDNEERQTQAKLDAEAAREASLSAAAQELAKSSLTPRTEPPAYIPISERID